MRENQTHWELGDALLLFINVQSSHRPLSTGSRLRLGLSAG